jgi:hypothetical protein
MNAVRFLALMLLLILSNTMNAAGPILFVTQVPIPGDDSAQMTATSSFANHLPTTASAPRGGDLMLRATNGTLRNLTQEAGFGNAAGFQGASSIALRDPAVHWSGTKAIFSMVVGSPTVANGPENYFWQLYEVDLSHNPLTAADIVAVANQPAFNNIHPNYLSDGSIVFVSDRPRNGSMLLYPIKDEYRGQPTNSGVWKLVPASGALTLLEHTPGGSFSPFVDSFGRLVFVRWDHLMQDANVLAANSPFDFVSESSSVTQPFVDLFPEPIQSVVGSGVNGYEINQFIPWMTNQDGSGEETLNHIGRHELRPVINRVFPGDPNLVVFQAPVGRKNISNFFHVREDPTTPGRYLGVDAPEFGTHTSGQIVAINAASGGVLLNANAMSVQHINNANLSNTLTTPSPIGHFRDPLPMSDGTLVAAFANTYPAEPTPAPAVPTYHFRLTTLNKNLTANGDAINSTLLTAGLTKTVSYFVGANLVTQTNAPMWELQPVEVLARTPPATTIAAPLATPELAAFAAAGVNESAFKQYLQQNNLAVLVMRNVTSRDAADRQQPFNLHVAVPGGTTTLAAPATGGLTYDLAWMQFFQADQVRGYGAPAGGITGRRTTPRFLNDPLAVSLNIPASAGAAGGSADISSDGSVAAFVPARRAMTWQSTSANNTPVVRERYWVEFQPGEVRACDGCHGANVANQAGQPAPSNSPLALVALLNRWKSLTGDALFADGFGP